MISILSLNAFAIRAACRRYFVLTGLLLIASVSGSFGQVSFQANSTSGCTPLGVVISVTAPAASSISSYAWTITTPSGSLLTASTAQYVAIFSQPGNYSVSLTINGNQTQTINNYITVHAKPTANFTVNDQTGCFPLCVNFSDVSVSSDGAIQEWSWDFGDGGTSNVQNPSHCYNQAGNFTPVFSVEDEYGCFASLSMPGLIQVVNNFPVANFTLSSQLDCNPPVNIQMTNTSTGTSALNSHWDFGDGATLNQSGTPVTNHAFQAAGNYNVCLTVTDQIGCEKSICKPLNVFENPNATFTTSVTTACQGSPILFTNTTSPVPPQVQWDFNNDGIFESTSQSVNYSYTSPGVYSPSMIVTYSPTCKDTVTLNQAITITNGVNVNFEADSVTACSLPFTVNFTNTSVGAGPVNYVWYIDNVQAGTGLNYTHTFNSYGTYSVKLVSTNASGCVNQHIKTNYISIAEPSVDFTHAASVCTGQDVPVTNVVVTSADPVATYNWDFNSDGITDATGLDPDFSYSDPGSYSITLTIVTENGCTATRTHTQNIEVLTQVSANFTASATTTCAGQPVEFCVDDQPGNTFSWNFYDGTGWVIMPLNESCITHDYADTGYFNLTLTVFNGACNVLQTFENYIYVAPPLAKFQYQVDCTDLLTVNFYDASIGADSLVWDFGDGSPLVINEANPVHTYTSQGGYTVTLTAFNTELGCPDIKVTDIAVVAPDASITIGATSGCPPLSVNLAPNNFNSNWEITVSNGDHISANWLPNMNQWQVNFNHDDTLDTYMMSGIDSPFLPQLTIEEGGYYDILVEVVDANGCLSSQFYNDAIHVAANPNFAAFTTNVIDACQTVQLAFNPVASNLVSCQWIFSDGTFSTSHIPIKTFGPPFNYNNSLSATLTATDVSGCTSTVTQPINLVLPPTLNFTFPPQPKCIGEEVVFTNTSTGPAGTTWQWNYGENGSAGNISNQYNGAHAYEANGDYTVCLTGNNGAGCVKTYCSPQQVQVANPEVNFTFSPAINNCLYVVQFNNTTPGVSSSSHWDYGDNQTGSGNTVFHTYPIGVYDVTLTVTNNYGCTDSLNIPDIFNYGNQIGPFTQVLDSANCAPYEVHFSSFNPNDTYFSYFWDFNDGAGDPSGSTSSDHTYLQPGSYCPSVIMTDPNGCNVLVSCQEPIVVDEFLMSYSVPPYICRGDTLHFQVNNATDYVWQNENELSFGNNPGEFFLHPDDDFTYILTGTYADCQRTDTILLVVRDLPSVTLEMPNYYCYGDPVVQLDGGFPNVPVGYYLMNNEEVTEFDPSMTPGQNYQLMYVYTDEYQCSANAILDVYIQNLPEIDFPDMGAVCEDNDVITLNHASPAGGIYYYNDDVITEFAPQISGEGVFGFTYHYTDNHGCSNEAGSQITIHPLPDISIDFDNSCLGQTVIFENNSTIPYGTITGYYWNLGNAGNYSMEVPPGINYEAIGEWPVQLVATSEIGCVSILDTTIYIRAVPQSSFTIGNTCQYEEQTLTATSTIEQGNITGWIWQIESNTIDSPQTLEYTFNVWGDVPVTLVSISEYGCADTTTFSVPVNPAPVVELEYENTCFGDESIFFASESLPFGGVIQREWQFGDDHPAEFEAVADNLYDSPGTYQLQYTALSNLGCTTIVHETLVVYPRPEPDLILLTDVICAGDYIQANDLSSIEGSSSITEWNWWLDNQQVGSSQNLLIEWQQPGLYNLTLSVRSNDGCTADSTISEAVQVNPTPVAGFISDTLANAYEPIIEIVNQASEDVTSWVYDFGDGQSAGWSDGSHEYQSGGKFTITQTVTNTFGCNATEHAQVTIGESLLMYIPNAFTPDGNGNNDVFLPVINGIEVTLYDFSVYNRWGEILFHTTDPAEGWDGRVGESLAPDGAYSWSMNIRVGDEVTIQKKSGSIMLLR